MTATRYNLPKGLSSMSPETTHIMHLMELLDADRKVRRAVSFVTPKLTIKLTRQHKPHGQWSSVSSTGSAPNFRERLKLKTIVKHDVALPVLETDDHWPGSRARKLGPKKNAARLKAKEAKKGAKK